MIVVNTLLTTPNQTAPQAMREATPEETRAPFIAVLSSPKESKTALLRGSPKSFGLLK